VAASFYWHDYETWGSVPAKDRPCQFAGLRTDLDLQEIGEPLVMFCRPADDVLPQPEACLVTGITPQRAMREGVPEAEFASAIQQVLAESGTCSVGYNSVRFDDEVTRCLFYRNLRDPYAHAYRNGNSRWDLIDVLRLAHALRPEGIVWPEREPVVASFKLEHLTAANGIPHVGAHDALADVRATIALARLLKQHQPKLFGYALTLRDKHHVRALLAKAVPLLHASQRFSASLGCIAPVISVAQHPGNPNALLCFDLRQDPAMLLDLSIDEIRARLFTAADKLPDGVERLPVKGIKVNAGPMLAPMSTLTSDAAQRWSIDPDTVAKHARHAADAAAEIASRLQQVFAPGADKASEALADPDLMLYSGGFFSDNDRRTMDRLVTLAPDALAAEHPAFEDARLATMLFRMRARSWPETLTECEREDWDAWRFERLTDPDAGGSISIDDYQQRIEQLRVERADDPAAIAVLDALEAWAESIMDAGI
jgi:exodeoxyribonuclease-1